MSEIICISTNGREFKVSNDYFRSLHSLRSECNSYTQSEARYAELLVEHDKQIRADILNEVSAKIEEIISDKCTEYGVGCIEAYCDACGEFEDWIKEQLKGAENE